MVSNSLAYSDEYITQLAIASKGRFEELLMVR